MIDETTGAAAIAYVGEKPWHGLGAELQAGQDLETWRKAAGLDWAVHESPVMYRNGELRSWDDRKVFFRSDTGAPLSVMGKGFNVVQPADVLDLYAEIAKAGGFSLETAGALDGGRRIWALARVSDGADVVNRDRVRPYVLLATSFDGTMATTAKFTAIRVVCHNTISMAIPQAGGGATERDSKAPGKQQVARVLHSTKWTDDVARDVRLQLGIVHNAYERFMVEARALAARPMPDAEADDFVAYLLEPYYGGTRKDGSKVDVRETRGYKRIIELFKAQAIGREMAGPTRWGMLNAVTQLVDHERGKSDATRLESAWFGTGNAIKERAFRILEGEFARLDA
ncbi:MAG: DUF932 domain-containing protein [Patescibacteria group bacterium]|nr:DUF932 domain-containing protein [Patescibacteria group bacterium]